MIKIDKSEEPDCLTVLKKGGATQYKALKDVCNDTVIDLLNKDQKGLCAYCQQSFESRISKKVPPIIRKNSKPLIYIEHYEAQSGKTGELDYSNFLGVCSGITRPKENPKKIIEHCDKSRKNKELTMNPENQTHIDTIYYDGNKICSSNDTFNRELNEVLNLNFDQMCTDRKVEFKKEQEIIELQAMEMGLSRTEAYNRAIQSVQKRHPNFTGYLLFRFEALLNHHLTKSNT